jgi:hypothetical protein
MAISGSATPPAICSMCGGKGGKHGAGCQTLYCARCGLVLSANDRAAGETMDERGAAGSTSKSAIPLS